VSRSHFTVSGLFLISTGGTLYHPTDKSSVAVKGPSDLHKFVRFKSPRHQIWFKSSSKNKAPSGNAPVFSYEWSKIGRLRCILNNTTMTGSP
jgi:hypothetical protein